MGRPWRRHAAVVTALAIVSCYVPGCGALGAGVPLVVSRDAIRAEGVVCRDGAVLRHGVDRDARVIRALHIGEAVYGLSLPHADPKSDPSRQWQAHTDPLYQDEHVAVVLTDGVTAGWMRLRDVLFRTARDRQLVRPAPESTLSFPLTLLWAARQFLGSRLYHDRDPSAVSALLTVFMDHHADEADTGLLRTQWGTSGREEPTTSVAAVLLGEARLELGDSHRAAAAFRQAVARADIASPVALRARRHLVALYAGPLDDRLEATRLCHEIIVEHAGATASGVLTERWADVEAAQMLVELWTRPPVEPARLREHCQRASAASTDTVVRLLASAGLVRALIAAGDSSAATALAVETLRGTPSAMRQMDAGGTRPFTDIRTVSEMYRVVRERRWQGGDAYVWSGAKPAVEVDYAHHVLAALVEGELAATQDYGAVIARLSSVRDSLPQMPRSLARYLRYLWVTLRYDGPTIVGIPGGPGHGAGPRGRARRSERLRQRLQGGAEPYLGRAVLGPLARADGGPRLHDPLGGRPWCSVRTTASGRSCKTLARRPERAYGGGA